MTTAVREAPHHNTVTCVKHYGCKRPECMERKRAYQETWRRNRATNPSLTDAEPVRKHLELLAEAGVGPRRVATLTGLSVETVAGFTRPYNSGRYGRKHKVRPDVAAKILALDPDTIVPGVTDATGSRRRVYALNATGWTNTFIAGQLPAGLGRTTIRELPTQAHVYARTADAITGLYDELKGKRPEEHGISPTSAHRARLRAERNQWPTIAYWATRMDVIDDPHFTPDYGITRRLIIAQDANEVMRFSGLDRQAAADRLGVHKTYIDHAFREFPQYAVEVAA